MKRYTFSALLLAAALTAAAAAGCSDKTGDSDRQNNSQTYSSYVSSGEQATAATQEGLAKTEIKVGVAEAADENQTTFKLNSVVDCGETAPDGRRYVYLGVTMGNTSSEDYELNCLNNFYILLPDGSESHFDIRTQIYANTNFSDNYYANPFIVPANGEFTGYIGGFLIPDGIDSMTVCFFPTQNNSSNKSSVIKCDVSAADMIGLPDDLKG